MARQTGVYQIVKNLCEFSMGLEKKLKYLSFFPVIKKKIYKNLTKTQQNATIILTKEEVFSSSGAKEYNMNNNNAKYNYRLLVVYQDGQTTTSTFTLRETAKTLFASIGAKRNVTYAEVLDMNTGNVIAEVHRAYQFKQNTYHR